MEEDSKVLELDFLAHGDAMQEARMTQKKSRMTWRGMEMTEFT